MTGFEVEVCTELPVIDGEAQMDDAKFNYSKFATLSAARKYAKEAFPGTPFGCAMIRGFRMEPISDEYPNVLEKEHTDFYEEVS